MRVRLHRKHVDIDGQGVFVLVDVVAAPGGNIEILSAKPQHVTGSRRPLIGEVQADAYLHWFWRRAGHEVKLDDEIALWLETPTHAFGRHAWRLPRRPPEKHSIRKCRLAAAASLVTGARLIIVAASREAGAIDLDVRLGEGFAVGGEEFGRPVLPR